MGKGRINAILNDAGNLTDQERVLLTKKLIKWTASDMRKQANAIKNLTDQLDSAVDCINRMRIDLADFKAKEAFNALKNAEQKLKESGGLGVVETERHEWDRDNEGFNVLNEFGCAAARNINKAAMPNIENNDTKTSIWTIGNVITLRMIVDDIEKRISLNHTTTWDKNSPRPCNL